MLLAIDVGNTHTTLALHTVGQWHSWRVHTNPARTADEHYALLRTLMEAEGLHGAIEGVVICSVVPALERTLTELATERFHCAPLFLSAHLDVGLRIAYDPPTSVGADRLANALAGMHLYGAPVIVVDFGTATTLDVVSREGVFLGGAILPGVELMFDSLAGRTARLPRVALDEEPTPIGHSTVDCLRSGVILGTVGAIEYLISRTKEQLGEGTRVVATGGLAEPIARLCPQIEEVNPVLTLEGLRLAWECWKAQTRVPTPTKLSE